MCSWVGVWMQSSLHLTLMLTSHPCMSSHSTSVTCCRHNNLTTVLRGGLIKYTLPKCPLKTPSVIGKHNNMSCTQWTLNMADTTYILYNDIHCPPSTTTVASGTQCQSYSCSQRAPNTNTICESYYNKINVMHKALLPNYSFSFGWMIKKCGMNTKRRSESNLVEPKSGLKSFRKSSCHFYSRRYI